VHVFKSASAAGLFVAVLLLTSSPAAQGTCECARAEAPCSAYWTGNVVFVGRVESVRRDAGGRRVTFSVLERFRGVSSNRVDVLTGASSDRCSLTFKAGREYVVYASRDARGVATGACSRTREIEDAAADLAYARSLNDGTAAPGRVSGQVLLGSRDLAGRTLSSSKPLEGLTVRVTKNDATTTAGTNLAGDFSIDALGAGRYQVRVDVPDGYYAENATSIAELPDPRACANVTATLYSNGLLSGRVVDASGRPVAGLTIDVSTPTLGQHRSALTDREGKYEVSRLPSGRFVVGIKTTPRIFHPGVDTIASAARITLAPGQRMALGDLRVPSRIKFIAVSGFVLDPDGTPAEGARVYLRGAAEGDRIIAEPAIVDFLGRFVIAALAGADYEIFAERSRSPGTDSTEPQRISASEELKPLRLVLRRRY
jgi:hypothetical protein